MGIFSWYFLSSESNQPDCVLSLNTDFQTYIFYSSFEVILSLCTDVDEYRYVLCAYACHGSIGGIFPAGVGKLRVVGKSGGKGS